MADTTRRIKRVLTATVLTVAVAVTGCSGGGGGSGGSGGDDRAAPRERTTTTTAGAADRGSTTSSTTTPMTSTTTRAPTTTSTAPSTAPPAGSGGTAGPRCVSGWTTPAPGTARRTAPLDIVRGQMGVTGRFEVIEMRHFTSPEVPWILAPRPPFVEWWYVKARLVDDPTFRARWLVAKRSEAVMGIAAVARFDTTGYRSPDWRAFIGDGEPRAIDGLPGTWVGIEFDFLRGEDGEKPGLPDEAIGCLDGT